MGDQLVGVFKVESLNLLLSLSHSLIPDSLCYLENVYHNFAFSYPVVPSISQAKVRTKGAVPKSRDPNHGGHRTFAANTKHRAQSLSSSGWLPWRVMLVMNVVGMREQSELGQNNRKGG